MKMRETNSKARHNPLLSRLVLASCPWFYRQLTIANRSRQWQYPSRKVKTETNWLQLTTSPKEKVSASRRTLTTQSMSGCHSHNCKRKSRSKCVLWQRNMLRTRLLPTFSKTTRFSRYSFEYRSHRFSTRSRTILQY